MRPTVVVGLGTFGAEVALRLGDERAGAERGRPVLVTEAAASPPEAIAARVVAACEPLLDLRAALEGDPGDDRRPSLDVFIVASLGEEEAAAKLGEIVDRIGRGILGRFSNIFPGNDLPNLGICPVVALLGARGGAATAFAGRTLADLERVARSMAFRSGAGSPVARVFVVERQSSRYELSPTEVGSTVVGFLSLVLGTDLRDREPLRTFLRSSVDHARDGRIFASFGSATLELAIEGACVPAAAAEVARSLRTPDGAASDVDVRAERLVPEAEEIVRSIESPSSGEELVTRIRAELPRTDFPAIETWHEPEHIRRVAYGQSFFDGLQARVKASVERIDGRTMDDLARIADERGLALVRRSAREITREIERAEEASPRGWMVALRLAEGVAQRARSRASEVAEDLRKEVLPPFPETAPVEGALATLREEADRRPRPVRHAFFAVLASVAAAVLLHPIPKGLYVLLLQREVPPFTFEGWAAVDAGPLGFLLDRPAAIVWVGLMFWVMVRFVLKRFREKREQALLGARDELAAAVRRYVEDATGSSIARYYESRLRFATTAWALRTLRRLADVATSRAERLGKIGAGLDRLLRDLDAEAKRASSGGESSGDLVYLRRVDEDVLAALREASRPPGGAVDRVLERLAATAPTGDVPSFLFEDRLRAAVAPDAVPPLEALAELLGPTVVRFVEQRQAKLAVPLEVTTLDEGSAERKYIFAPTWAMAPLEAARERWPLLPAPEPHDDRDRVHLLSVRTGLAKDAITLPGGTLPGGAGAVKP